MSTRLPGGLLLAAQPQALTAERLVALDDWVRAGGRLVLLADPSLRWESSRPLGDRFRPPYAFPDPESIPDQALAEPPTLNDLISPRHVDSERTSLFDDANGPVPGTVHHQSDEQINHMLARVGAVRLVRQLAEDLASRDAQITSTQRRAERRERLLRYMLRECEISNIDIERRLKEEELTHQIETTRNGIENDVMRRMNLYGNACAGR